MLRDAVGRYLMRYCYNSELTQNAYRYIFDRAVGSLPERLMSVRSEHIENYLLSLKGYNNNTINTHLSVIKSFFKWVSLEFNVKDPARNVKFLPKLPPKQRVLSDEEYNKLSVKCADDKYWPLFLIGNTGLRVGELVALKPSDYDGRFITVKCGKRNKRRRIPVNKTVQQLLSLHPINFSKNTRAIWLLCRSAGREAGVEPFGPHALRHWFATTLYKKGVPIGTISKLLGHSSIMITMGIYIHLVEDDFIGVTDVLDN